MTSSPPFQIILTLTQLAWPVFTALMVMAAILFVRADRRHPAFCFLAGSILQCFISLWSLFAMGPLSSLLSGFDQSETDFEKYFAIQAGAGAIAQGLIVYGLLMIGLIQLKKSLQPPDWDREISG